MIPKSSTRASYWFSHLRFRVLIVILRFFGTRAKLLFDPVRDSLPSSFRFPSSPRPHLAQKEYAMHYGERSFGELRTCAARCPPLAPPRGRAAKSAAATPGPPPDPDSNPGHHLETEALRRLVHGLQGRLLPLSCPGRRAPRRPVTGPAQGQGRRHQAASHGSPGGAGERGPQFIQHHGLLPPTAAEGNRRGISMRGLRRKTRPGPRIQRPPALEGGRGGAAAADPRGGALLSGSRPEAGKAQPSRSSAAARLGLLRKSSRTGPGGAGGAPDSLGRPRKLERSSGSAPPFGPTSALRAREPQLPEDAVQPEPLRVIGRRAAIG